MSQKSAGIPHFACVQIVSTEEIMNDFHVFIAVKPVCFRGNISFLAIHEYFGSISAHTSVGIPTAKSLQR